MDLVNICTIGLLGYIITVNEEIHSRQIKWLNAVLIKFDLLDSEYLIKDILDDKEEKVPFNECFSAFQAESLKNKNLIYQICYQLAIMDNDIVSSNNIDSLEDGFLKSLQQYLVDKDIPYLLQQAIDIINKDFIENDFNNSNSFNIDFDRLLNVASADYNEYEKTFNKIFTECNKLTNQLQSKKDSTELNVLKTNLESFLYDYKENVILSLSELKKSSIKKELAANNFSIALMGRTKAGKSTLHYIMCNEGKEFIGKGAQRTTRFNRVFSWNRLKIIDTPGIGAGEEQGKKDEKIALSILSQADMICFVVVDDTIQNDVLDLINTIAEYHKPMLIVLNHKENIRKKSHLKSFKEDPDNWRLTEGESNLEGYKNRLKRNAKKHNYDNLINVVPVFLLAAQMGMENTDEFMINASNYPAFIDAIQSIISNNSLIYKSQTMLDEPSIRLHKSYIILNKEEAKLITLKNKIIRIRKQIENSMRSSKKSIMFEVEKAISIEYDNYYTAKSYEYMEENYKEKSIVAINDSFNKYLEEYGIKDNIQKIVSEYIESYHNKITDIVSEIDEELSYAKLNTDIQYSDNSADIKRNHGTFSFKGVFKAASMVLDVLSIIYPVLAIISIPISLFGGFFKSKQQKIDDAKALTLENFEKLNDYSKKQVSKKTQEILRNLFDEDSEEMTAFFNELEEQLNSILDYVSSCRKTFNDGIHDIDMNLAYRVLEYIGTDNHKPIIVDVRRDIENHIFTITIKNQDLHYDFDISKYTGISSEKLNIKYIN